MMEKPVASSFSVGFVLFVAMILIILALFWVGSTEDIFADHTYYRASFPSTSGLRTGSRVYLSGVPVGTVKTIDFCENIRDNNVVVTLAVAKRVERRIREDSYIWLQTEGLLGDVSVHIAMGTAEASELDPDIPIEYKQRPLLAELAGEEITESTSDLLRAVIRMLQDINKGEGTLGKMLKNPDLYNNLTTFSDSLNLLSQDLTKMSGELREIVDEVRSQKGTLGKLIFSTEYEREFSKTLTNTSELVKGLRETVDIVRRGDGALGKLLTSADFHDRSVKAIENISLTSAKLTDVLHSATQNQSVVGRLVTDPELGNRFAQIVDKLDRSATSLETVLQLLEHGEGSLGIALHDPSIATSLRNIFLGVQESGLVQSMVRSAEEDGRVAWVARMKSSELARREAARARALAVIDQPEGSVPPDGKGLVETVPTTAKEKEAPGEAKGTARTEADPDKKNDEKKE